VELPALAETSTLEKVAWSCASVPVPALTSGARIGARRSRDLRAEPTPGTSLP
jgi:hypothetical protein